MGATGTLPPNSAHQSPQPPNRFSKTGRAFRAPRQPFRAPRHPQPHTHAKHTLVSMWERGEAFGGPWGLGDRRSHGPWAVAEPTNQTPRKSGQGVQKNVRGWVGLIYPLGTPAPGFVAFFPQTPQRLSCGEPFCFPRVRMDSMRACASGHQTCVLPSHR